MSQRDKTLALFNTAEPVALDDITELGNDMTVGVFDDSYPEAHQPHKEQKNENNKELNPFSFYNFLKSNDELQQLKVAEDAEGGSKQVLDEEQLQWSDCPGGGDTSDASNNILWYTVRLRELEDRVTCLSTENERLTRERALKEEKEAKEVAALEKLVQSVEEKLSINQKRCALAEEKCARQSGEIKKLKSLVKKLGAENKALKTTVESDEVHHQLREQSLSAAEQLSSAAMQADAHIKSLQSGVGQLQLLSQLLSSAASNTTYDLPPENDCGESDHR